MNYLGDFAQDATVYIYFTTHAVSGGPVAPLSAFEAADVKIYKSGSATEKATANGVTMTSPFDSIVGLHLLAIDTSVDTGDSGFWAGGADYSVVLNPDTETVDSQTALKVLATFSCENRSALRPTTAGRTLDVSSGGEAGVDWANVGSPTTTNNLSGTSTKAVEPTVAGRTLDVSAGGEAGVDWANVGSPTTTLNLSGTTVKTATDVETDTQDIQGRLPAALVSGRMDANMQAAANGVITAAVIADAAIDAATFAAGAIDNAAIATDAIGSAELAASAVTEIQSGLSTLDAAAVRSAIGLATANLDTQLAALLALGDTEIAAILAAVDTEVAAIKAQTDKLTFDGSNNLLSSVQAIASAAITAASIAANALTAAKIATDAIGAAQLAADAVTEIQSGISVLTAAGVRAAVGLASANLDTQLSAIDDFLDTEVAAIKAKTDNLPADPADASDIAASFSSLNTEVAAIKAKTDNLPSDPADQSLLMAAIGSGGGGATAAEVWAYGSRTLTQTAAEVASVMEGSDLTIQRGDTFTLTLTGLGSVADRTKLWFGLKRSNADADSAALVVIEETDGLLTIAGKAAATAGNGEIVVDDEDAGDITITLTAAETAKLAPRRGCAYDVQMLTSDGGVQTLTQGEAAILADTLRATS